MMSLASKTGGCKGHPHLGSLTPQAPVSPCISLSFHLPLKSEGISTTRRSIHLRQKSRKINMTTRTALSPPSPKIHPTMRKTTSRALTRTAVALQSDELQMSPFSTLFLTQAQEKKACVNSSTHCSSES